MAETVFSELRMRTILIIDDDASVVDMERDFFESNGYRVLSSQSAQKGLQLAFDENPQVVLLDFNLKDTTGEEVLVGIKQNRPGIKVIIVTGNSDEDLEKRLLSKGADYFFDKYGSLRDLHKKVVALSS